MNSQSSVWLRAFACIGLLGMVLATNSALAQRAISNTSSGGDPTRDVAVDRLVNCELGNTSATVGGAISGGFADACSRVNQSGETLAQIQAITAGYNAANPASLYNLQLLNITADRLSLGNSVSSGGLFGIAAGGGLNGMGALGNDHVEMQFFRGAVGSFVMSFSGTFDDGLPGNTADSWSAYYLFDDVEIRPFGIDSISTGLMNYRLFQNRSRVDPLTGGTELFRDYTRSLVVNQVSIYALDRQDRTGTVPEPGTWALVFAGLSGAAWVRRRRRLGLSTEGSQTN